MPPTRREVLEALTLLTAGAALPPVIASETVRRCVQCGKPLQKEGGRLEKHYPTIERTREDELCLPCPFAGIDDDFCGCFGIYCRGTNSVAPPIGVGGVTK
jgi:hypothetical protein